jgi:hypothetical protein
MYIAATLLALIAIPAALLAWDDIRHPHPRRSTLPR